MCNLNNLLTQYTCTSYDDRCIYRNAAPIICLFVMCAYIRCVQFNNLIEVCAQHSLATNNYLYQYTSVHNLTTFGNLLSVLESFTRLITDGCFNTTASFICNGIFVPCDLTTGEAKAICTNSCYKFKEDCTLEYDSIIKGAALIEGIILQLESFCADTLVLIKDAFGANTTASGVECNCLDVQST